MQIFIEITSPQAQQARKELTNFCINKRDASGTTAARLSELTEQLLIGFSRDIYPGGNTALENYIDDICYELGEKNIGSKKANELKKLLAIPIDLLEYYQFLKTIIPEEFK